MNRKPTQPPSMAIRRIVACAECGGRRRTLADSAQGVRAHCMGCGVEVSFPFATEHMPAGVGRAGHILAA